MPITLGTLGTETNMTVLQKQSQLRIGRHDADTGTYDE